MKRKIIYTCITNNYDSLKEPLVITEGWEYTCFTNNKEIFSNKNTAWNVIYMDLPTTKHQREIKINPSKFFNYDLCIWIDGSIRINCNLNEFVQKNHLQHFTTLLHPHRNCVYEEAETCIKLKKDDRLIISEQMYDYRKAGFPRDRGMIGSGLIIRTRSNENDDFCFKWWKEVEKYSKRDQLSFNYVLYHNPIPHNLISFGVLKNEFTLLKHTK
mgnify:CR=1 FL=1